MFARSTDDGATWTELAPLNPNAPGDTGTDDSPRLACSGGGEWLAVWISTETFNGRLGSDLDVLVSRGLGAGLHWTHPMPLTNYARTDTGSDFRPFAAGDGAGAWVVVWSSLDPLVNQVGTDEDILTVNTPLIRLKLGGPLVR
jgi:hypothetical protein